jgi:hypothetical protein
MRRSIWVLFASAFLGWAADGLPVRGAIDHYPAQAERNGLRVAAEAMSEQQVRGSFATDLSRYLVVEVAVYPRDNEPIDLAAIDFGLRDDKGRLVRPAEPATIARLNQKRGQSRANDIVLYPTVGVTTGTWGTGTSVGVGVGVGGNNPGPASTDADRRVMRSELEEKALQDGRITKPVAGYLYFPVGTDRKDTYELTYSLDQTDLKLKLKPEQP